MLMVSVLLLAKYKDPCRWCGITGEAVEVDRQFLFGLYFLYRPTSSTPEGKLYPKYEQVQLVGKILV